VLIWVAEGKLEGQARELIEERAEAVMVSAASIWEIEIKRALGRLDAPEDLPTDALDAGFAPLQITFEHALAAGRLPPIHRDPFDRMLVAQARLEGLTLATADPEICEYDVETLAISRP
jgi:PIN domain nuclease of toxin-antitoxin system